MADRPLNVPLALALPLSWLYGGAMAVHRAVRRGSAVRLGIPVVSVGNLSVGGTGKTPMVLHLVRALVAAGRRPCIAMRGYGAGAGESDEAEVYRRAFVRQGLDVPVVAQADRAAGVRALVAAGGVVDVVVLDDGFQHHRLARDLDVVLVDATRSPFADRLLPAGWLREPPGVLERAGAVVVTHAEGVDAAELAELEDRLGRVHGRAPVAVARHEWTALDVTRAGGGDVSQPVAWLAGKRVLVVCAIGNPGALLREASKVIGAEPSGSIILRDHDPYEDAAIGRVLAAARGVEVVLTTDKDWSKLARVPAERWPCAVARPRLELAFERGEAALTDLVIEAVGGTRTGSKEPGATTRAARGLASG